MANSNPNPLHTPYRVLIVDDDAVQRTLEREILSGPDYVVSEVGNGLDAIAAVQEHEFDVVLLDKRMPDLDGDQVCKRIRNELNMPLLPVIMVTGSDAYRDLARSMEAGANDFVRKPYNPLELVSRVNAAANSKRLTDQLDSAESLLFALARMVEAKDEPTGDHCTRLSHNVAVFGAALGLDEEELLALRRGGVLHDIGKLGIPDSILLKRGPLDEREWVIMRQHTVIGAHLCRGLKSMRLTVPIIQHHHERWDGSGYPDGLQGEEIPYLARVFQIVDIYDALASERPYKKALPREKVIEIMQSETDKGWRDPSLMAAFLDILRNRYEDLIVPGDVERDLGAKIFDEILATGVLDWDQSLEKKETA